MGGSARKRRRKAALLIRRKKHNAAGETAVELRLHFQCLDGRPQGYIFKWLDALMAELFDRGIIVMHRAPGQHYLHWRYRSRSKLPTTWQCRTLVCDGRGASLLAPSMITGKRGVRYDLIKGQPRFKWRSAHGRTRTRRDR